MAKRDLKVNYAEIVALLERIQEVKENFLEFQAASRAFKEAVGEQKGSSIDSLLDFYESNIDIHQKEFFQRLEKIEEIIKKYIEESTYYISPVHDYGTVHVNSDDISLHIHNMKQALGAISEIILDPIPQSSGDYSSIGKDHASKEEAYADKIHEQVKRESNYQKLKDFQSFNAKDYEQILMDYCKHLERLSDNYVAPYVDADTKYGQLMYELLTQWDTGRATE